MLLQGAGEPEEHLAVVRDRPGHRGARGVGAVIAGVDRQCAVEVGIGPLGGDADGAGRRVAAEERALRPLEHLDPGHVEQVELQARRAGQVDLVHEEGDARVGTGIDLIGAAAAHVGVADEA